MREPDNSQHVMYVWEFSWSLTFLGEIEQHIITGRPNSFHWSFIFTKSLRAHWPMRQSCQPCLSRGLLAGDQVIMIWRICSIYQQTASNCSPLSMHLSLQHTPTSHETTGGWNVCDCSCHYSVISCRETLDPGSPVTTNCHKPSHPLADQAHPPWHRYTSV